MTAIVDAAPDATVSAACPIPVAATAAPALRAVAAPAATAVLAVAAVAAAEDSAAPVEAAAAVIAVVADAIHNCMADTSNEGCYRENGPLVYRMLYVGLQREVKGRLVLMIGLKSRLLLCRGRWNWGPSSANEISPPGFFQWLAENVAAPRLATGRVLQVRVT